MTDRCTETWGYIERLLIEECGLLPDQGLAQQRQNFINAIRQSGPSATAIKGAAELLRLGGLYQIRVDGKMMTRQQVADLLDKGASADNKTEG